MHELELRISDVDRARAAAALNTAVSEGRLTWPEHEERVSRVHAARTGAELAPLLADLPQAVQTVLPAFAPAASSFATPPPRRCSSARSAAGRTRPTARSRSTSPSAQP